MNGKAFTILNTSCLSELSRIMAAKNTKKSVPVTDNEVQTFLDGEENQYAKSVKTKLAYRKVILDLFECENKCK